MTGVVATCCTSKRLSLFVIAVSAVFVALQQWRLLGIVVASNGSSHGDLLLLRNSLSTSMVRRGRPAPQSAHGDDGDGRGGPAWAYAFLVGGVRSTHRVGADYRGGLYSTVSIVHKLRSMNSRADFVVMVQMSSSCRPTPEDDCTALTKFEQEVFAGLGVHVVYIPQVPHPTMENFYSLVVRGKFWVLNLTRYTRVMFLDNDIFPRCNLDYLFELSETRRALKPNIVLGWKDEPSNAGNVT
jgi:hypothetical protein